MAISVDVDCGRCCGWGNCAQVCPEVFELDPQTNRARLRHKNVPDELTVQVQEAAAECPTQAIELSSEELP
jgi:ferredoxin